MEHVRTCLGCRVRADKSVLLRVVARDGVVIPDPSAALPGRGAWVHPSRTCIENSIKRKAFGRALRATVAPDTEQLIDTVQLPETVKANEPVLPTTVGTSSEVPVSRNEMAD